MENSSCLMLTESNASLEVSSSSSEEHNLLLTNANSIGKKDYVAVFEEASTSELLQKKVSSDCEAYDLYNEYAFKCGFGIRKGKRRTRAKDGSVSMRQMVCWKAGFKNLNDQGAKLYSKIDYRTGCKAHIQFHVDENGVYTVVNHVMGHNHEMVPSNERHLIRSHRAVHSEQLSFITNLKESGVPVSDAVRVLRKEVGGSPNLGFTARDAYNAVASEKAKKLELCDSRQLIRFFADRQAKEAEFYYDVEVDDFGNLVSFFWRDWRMKRDYLYFGDLLIHDTTYRTNKYELICGLFVGMNHHTNNVMFGCGFLLNERTESFIWLFNSFLTSMGGKKPITMMTDQSAAMAAAINIVLPSVRHRLCTWHISENSKKNIAALRAKEGFVDVFNTVLKYSDTIAEFEYYWKGMMETFDCSKSKWLNNLYSLKEKWCSAYSKKFFSGGILSSQRSETTNKSVKRKLRKTHGLCDFYKLFLDVMDEWRSKENGENYQCNKGNRHLAFAHLKLLQHASEVYTIEVYKIFEDEFIKGTECDQQVFCREYPIVGYHVGRPDVDLIKHQVVFNELSHVIECTCNYFSEAGLLCFHCLRIYHMHCVPKIPEQYILWRWTRSAMCTNTEEKKTKVDSDCVSSSVWRAQMMRKFVRLILASQTDPDARRELEVAFECVKEKVESIIGNLGEGVAEEDIESVFCTNVKNPMHIRPKYERNSRPKSIIEKKCNRAKGWRKKAATNALKVKNNAQTALKSVIVSDSSCGNLVHPSNSGSQLTYCGFDDYFGVTITSVDNS